MNLEELSEIKARWELARMAGQDADEAGNGWDQAKIRALVRSWQDIPDLYDAAKQLVEAATFKTLCGWCVRNDHDACLGDRCECSCSR